MAPLATLCYWGVLAGAMLAARSFSRKGRPRAAFLLCAAVGVPSVLQFVFPQLLVRLGRDPAAVLHGEVWRLVTANFVQDGGLPGTVFNLLALALIAPGAERAWGTRHTVGLFLACGVAWNAAAVLLGSAGAGNSCATFALAASMAVAALRQPGPGRIGSALCLAAGAGLFLAGDPHWIGIACGALAGIVCLAARRAGPVRT